MTRTRAGSLGRALILFASTIVGLTGTAHASDFACVQWVGGDAFGVSAVASAGGVPSEQVAPTARVDLPAGGGTLEDSSSRVSLVGVLTRSLTIDAGIAAVRSVTTTQGAPCPTNDGYYARSTARVDGVQRIVALPEPFSALSSVSSNCAWLADNTPQPSVVFGNTRYTSADGRQFEIPPNTVVPIPNVGSVIFNEQIMRVFEGTWDGQSFPEQFERSLTVNAVHVFLDGGGHGGGEVIIGQAACDPFRFGNYFFSGP